MAASKKVVQYPKQTAKQSLEKGGLLGIAMTLIGTGTTLAVTEKWFVGLALVAFGVGLLLVREYRK